MSIRGVGRQRVGIIDEEVAEVERVRDWFRYCDGAGDVSLERPADDRVAYDFDRSVSPWCAVGAIGSEASRASRACAMFGNQILM